VNGGLVDRWLVRLVAVILLVAGVVLAAREIADWMIWRRDVNMAIQQLAQRVQTAPPAAPGAAKAK